jgi:hypothetical protein
MKRVIIESPFSPSNGRTVEQNIRYARQCVRDSIIRGEAPIASHLLHTQEGILNDDDPAERSLGMEAGFAWTEVAELVVVYDDFGISPGMHAGIDRAKELGIRVQVRMINP